MKERSFKLILALCWIVSAIMMPHVQVRPALAQESPTAIAGFGAATAAPFISYVGHDGAVRQVFSVNTIGNLISFSFNARKAEDGTVEGEMQLVDHTLGLVVHSDVAEFDVNRMHNRPVGSTGSPAARMRSSTESVVVDGEPRPGWRFVNSPVFDGGNRTADTIRFELFSAENVLLFQWSAFLSSGNVKIKH
ncbi:MAG TPA: hypothetical protein VFM35_08640 [Candidatus Binatia bacterium]|nr:hypothetical protein [Candidatus Binatia bacterium]